MFHLLIVFNSFGEETPSPKWVVGPVLEFPFYSFYLGTPNLSGVAYLPNFSPRIGLRGSFKKFDGKISWALPLPSFEEDRRGSSEQTQFLINYFDNSQAFNFYYLKATGLYATRPYQEMTSGGPSLFPQFPDARTFYLGLNWYKSLDEEAFDIRSAFSPQNFDLKEGFSWVVSPFIRSWSLSLGRVFLPGSDGTLTVRPQLNDARLITSGGSFGFAKSFALGNWAFNFMPTVGAGVQFQEIDLENQKTSRDWGLAGKLNLSSSIGRKIHGQSFGVVFLVDSLYTDISGTQIYASLINAEFFYLWKF